MEDSSLGELKKRLYQKEAAIGQRPAGDLGAIQAPKSGASLGGASKKSFLRRNLWAIIISTFVLVVGGIFLYLGLSTFSEAKLSFDINGQTEIGGGDLASWEVSIKNQNRVTLQNLKLVFTYPDGSRPEDDRYVADLRSEIPLDDIAPNQSFSRVFKARVLGEENEIKTIKATLSYQIQGIARTLQKDSALQFKISTSPLILDIRGPQSISNKTTGVWHITYKNGSDVDFPQVRLRLQYPDGFTFISSKPAPSGNSGAWGPAFLKAGQENTIDLQGQIEGNPNDQKTIEAFIDLLEDGKDPLTLAHKISTSVLSVSPLITSVTVNGKENPIAHKGDTLEARISYENDFTQPVSDVFLEAQIVGEMVDRETIEPDNGGTLSLSKEDIRWDKATTPALESLDIGGKGEVSFHFKVKDTFPINTFSDKNFTIQISSKISSDSPPLPLSTDSIAYKSDVVIPIGTQAELKTDGTYYGDPFPNTGPLPPKVGQKTTYTVFWRIINSANDLQNVTVQTQLPVWASYKGVKKINFGEAGFSYSQAKKILTWHLDKIPATTGVALPTYEAAFQIEVVPTPDQVGSLFDIIGQTSLRATDNLTQEDISLSGPSVRSNLGGSISNSSATVVN